MAVDDLNDVNEEEEDGEVEEQVEKHYYGAANEKTEADRGKGKEEAVEGQVSALPCDVTQMLPGRPRAGPPYTFHFHISHA